MIDVVAAASVYTSVPSCKLCLVSYRFPERIEQIFVDGDDLYVLFESAAYAYSSASVNIVDRVLKLSLPRMEEYQQSIQSNVSQY